MEESTTDAVKQPQPKKDLGDDDDIDLSKTSRVFASLLLDQINFPDVNAVLDSQSQIIKRLDQTNRNVSRTNQMSTETFNSYALKDFQSYIGMLGKMKSDLDFIFKHIRIVKSKLQTKYPTQYEKAFKEYYQNFDMDDTLEDEKEEDKQTAVKISHAAAINNKERSSPSSLLVNLFETARTRLSSMEIVNGLMSTPTTASIATNDNPADSQILGSEIKESLVQDQSETSTIEENTKQEASQGEATNTIVQSDVVDESATQ